MNEEPSPSWNVEDASYLEDEFQADKSLGSRIKVYLSMEGLKLLFILVYLAANIGLFVYSYLKYFLASPTGPAVTYEAFTALGQGVAIARGAANALKLNSVFILIPVCRNLLSWLRGTWLNNVLPIDKNIVFHKWIGGLILFWALVHMTAHYTNYYKLSQLPHFQPLPPQFAALGANGVIAMPTWRLAYTTLTGATGHVALFCLIIMYSAAVESVRRRFFEIFWYSHHLFIIFFGCLLAHGMAQLFEPAQFWMWFIGPGLLYTIERVIRIARGSIKFKISQAIQHPSNVMELRLQRMDGKPFKYKSGQYCYIKIPALASVEWHPFTITSAPNGDDFLSFHIKGVGDWTGSLQKLLNPGGEVGEAHLHTSDEDGRGYRGPFVRVDGPFGTASEDVFDYESVVLVGAGIGVTPFASILKNIEYNISRESLGGYHFDKYGNASPLLAKKVRVVHFYWVCRDKTSFEWFSQLLAELEEHNLDHHLVINIYLTGRVTKSMHEMMDGSGSIISESDSITGLRTQTTFGRPDWEDVFGGLATKHRGQKVGVFFCGPKVLSKVLKKQCKDFSDVKTKTRFVYSKENF